MDLGHYILEGHTPVHIPCDHEADNAGYMDALLRWARWFEEHRAECVVARTHIGDYEIATDFLGLDHGIFRGGGRPLLFETIVFSGFQRRGPIGQLERCSTWEEAEAQHERIAASVGRLVNG